MYNLHIGSARVNGKVCWGIYTEANGIKRWFAYGYLLRSDVEAVKARISGAKSYAIAANVNREAPVQIINSLRDLPSMYV